MVTTLVTVPRRRPATRNGRPTLTPDLIARAALDLAGAHGFPAVTMRRLASHLGVTVRALYNHVADRQEVIDRAARLFLAEWQAPALDPDDWELGLAAYAAALRCAYRRHPRALLIALDEQVSPAAVHPNRLTNVDALLGLLRAIGLDALAAQAVHRDLALRVFAFVLLVDQQGGDAPAQLPPGWLAAHPDLALPHLREAATLAAPDADAAFDQLVDGLVAFTRMVKG